MAKKHHKSQRNIPELYDQVKQAFSFSLTPTAVKKLEEMAKSLGLSRSELVEQIARGIWKLNLTTSEQSQPLSKNQPGLQQQVTPKSYE